MSGPIPPVQTKLVLIAATTKKDSGQKDMRILAFKADIPLLKCMSGLNTYIKL